MSEMFLSAHLVTDVVLFVLHLLAASLLLLDVGGLHPHEVRHGPQHVELVLDVRLLVSPRTLALVLALQPGLVLGDAQLGELGAGVGGHGLARGLQ